MDKLDITRILSSTKYEFPLQKGDKSIWLVDIDKASDKILELINGKDNKQEKMS